MKKIIFFVFIELLLFVLTIYLFAHVGTRIQTNLIDLDYISLGLISIILHGINIIILYIVFNCNTNKYPQNNPNEYIFDPVKSILTPQNNGDSIFVVCEIEKGIWKIEDKLFMMRFDLRGYIFPRMYISSYFVRNIHFMVINKNKYHLIKLFKSLELAPYSIPNDVILLFKDKKRTKRIVIIKNNKTKVNFIMCKIIRSRYFASFLTLRQYAIIKKSRIKINEEKYKHGNM